MAELHSPEKNNLQQLITEHIDLWTGAVKAKSSAGRGGSSKRELYGIKKLRELILELAVRGKLVQQDPNDEPASVLLERIAAEKAELVKQGKIKKPKKLPEISEDEKPFELPEGWEWARLGEVGLGSTGKTPNTGKSEYFNSEGIPFIGPGQITEMGAITQADKYLTNTGAAFSTEALPNDILMVCIGGSIGKSSLVHERLTFNQQINCISPLLVKPKYLLLALQTREFYQSLLDNSSGSATPIINRSKWEALLVPLAPVEQQSNIVSKVDELMALCDQLEQQTEASLDAHQTLVQTLLDTLLQSPDAEELEQNWQRLSAHFDLLFTTEQSIDQLKQTILQLAVMGKLVPQDPNDEPASELLKRIAAEKEELVKQKKIKKQKPLSPISEDEKPFQLPKGWEWINLDELAFFQKGYAFKSKDYLDKGVMITKIQNLSEGCVANSVYLDPSLAKEFEDYKILENDIVMTTVGSWFSAPASAVGRTFIVDKAFDSSLLNQNAVRIKPVTGIQSKFLYFCLNSKDFKSYLVKEAQGTANQASITQASIKSYMIGISPTNEQRRIVAKVDQLMTLCDQLKAKLADSKTTQLNLTDALVAQAV